MTTQQKQSKENGVYGKRWVANGKQVNNVFNELVIQLLTCVWLFKTSWTAAAGLLWPLLSLGVCSKWRSLSLWCYLSLSSSAAPLNLVNPSVQFSSVTQSCPTLCDLKDCSMPGLPVAIFKQSSLTLPASQQNCFFFGLPMYFAYICLYLATLS